ncbi:MAG: glycoside hydrolase family 15 protein, partial [SAR202 cluster bacterium]|nr:glycoside hydrolase family 15 protein [SAR202 cluster bacterium]
GGVVTDEAWSLVENFAEVVCNKWRLKDRGVWEVRGPQQHFVYSKLMSWVALDRAARIAEALGRNGAVDRWRQTAAAIKEEVIRCGWNDRKQAFVQHYATDSLDASNLVLPLIGFLRPNDPRILSTIEAIRRELADGPLVQRYIPDQTEDGLGGQNEGAFTILSFWLIGGLIRTGRVETAAEYFEQMLSCSNHLGLFAEMIDPTTKQLLGNFPQAYSHIGLIHSARNLSRVLSGGNSRSDGTRAVSV